MAQQEIPAASFGIVGGSGTLSSDFPARLPAEDVEILADNLIFDTPYGKSPAFRLFAVGVVRVLSEGGVGTANHLLDPRDFLIPDDYLDLSNRKDVMLDGRYLLIMRDALCPELRASLLAATKKRFSGRIFDRGIYACTDGRHFESSADVAMLKGHADIIGQSICPEVYLAREIGACYAGLYYVVNYGEGIRPKWSYGTMKDIFYDDAPMIGEVLAETIRETAAKERHCECLALRKETLLKDVYNEASDKG